MALDSLPSRYAPVALITDPQGHALRDERNPFRFRRLRDTRVHRARDGDTLQTLASRFYSGATRQPAQLWWVIADFQPEPIQDPTIALEPGRLIYIPSPATVQAQILGGVRDDFTPIG